MRHKIQMKWFFVYKAVLCVCFIALLQACQTQLAPGQMHNNKTDLNQAATYNVQLGLSYLKQGTRPRAKKKLLLALNQAPNSPDVNAAIAYYFEQTHELELAKEYYLKALALSSNSGAQLNNYGTFLCRQAQYQQAEAYFLKAVQDVHYLNTSGAYENAGLCSLAIPDYKKAKLYFTAALNQDPSRRESLYELVTLDKRMGKDLDALSHLKKYPDLVLNDKPCLALAKQIAKQTADLAYLRWLDKMQNTNTSGAKNDYRTDNG